MRQYLLTLRGMCGFSLGPGISRCCLGSHIRVSRKMHLENAGGEGSRKWASDCRRDLHPSMIPTMEPSTYERVTEKVEVDI